MRNIDLFFLTENGIEKNDLRKELYLLETTNFLGLRGHLENSTSTMDRNCSVYPTWVALLNVEGFMVASHLTVQCHKFRFS